MIYVADDGLELLGYCTATVNEGKGEIDSL